MIKTTALLAFLFLTQDANIKWIHGSNPCSANRDPAFHVHAYDADTYILRQNKCTHFEAPFIYLLFGRDKVFMQDTGAALPANSALPFPVRETANKIIQDRAAKNGKARMQLLVTHSHAHGDHIGGDSQFAGQPDTVVVGTKLQDVQRFFGFRNWPQESATLDLGGRTLDIIPIPGHEPTSLAVYDRRTRLLLTGDTLYPGRLYVRDFEAFRKSIERLAAFVKANPVSGVLGTHIEMSDKPGVDYPVRTTYQPNEHPLALSADHVFELHEALTRMKDGAVREVHNSFIVWPVATEYTIEAIRFGTIPQFRASGLVIGADPSQTLDIAVMVWLIRGGGRTILFDTGFHRQTPGFDRFRTTDYIRPDEAIKLAGVQPSDVTDVIISHVHWDHMGGIDLFPNATIWIQRAEYEYYTGMAWQEGGRRGGELEDLQTLLRLNVARKVKLIDGDDKEIIPGIRVYTGARHTYASQYIRVQGNPSFVLASDNCYLYRNLETKSPIATFEATDRPANVASFDRMIQLAGAQERVIPGHDMLVFQRFPTNGRIAKIK